MTELRAGPAAAPGRTEAAWKRRYRSPRATFPTWARDSADRLLYVARVRAPVLMLVGQNDPRCPSRSADVYEARLRELGKTFETYRYDAGHGSLVVDEQIKQMEIQIGFLAKHLGTAAPLR